MIFPIPFVGTPAAITLDYEMMKAGRGDAYELALHEMETVEMDSVADDGILDDTVRAWQKELQ